MAIEPKTDGQYLAALAAEVTGERPYLGDPDYVDSVVREFATSVLNDADAADTPEKAKAAGSAAMARATGLGLLFTHMDSGRAIGMTDWNKEGGGLGRLVKERFADQVDGIAGMTDAAAITNAFAIMAHAILEAVAKHDEDSDTEDAANTVNALVDDWTNLMLGVPNADDVVDGVLAASEAAPVTDYDGQGGAGPEGAAE